VCSRSLDIAEIERQALAHDLSSLNNNMADNSVPLCTIFT
jgi:hypothetical protein